MSRAGADAVAAAPSRTAAERISDTAASDATPLAPLVDSPSPLPQQPTVIPVAGSSEVGRGGWWSQRHRSPAFGCNCGVPHGGPPGYCGGPVVWGADGLSCCVPSPNEWLCNGGDQPPEVQVRRDWEVFGLQLGDAVAHYDTVDGHTYVAPTNEVCLYAPRFAAVRKVSGAILQHQHERPAGIELPTRPNLHNEALLATTVVQPLQPIRNVAIGGPNTLQEQTRGLHLENTQVPLGTEAALLPYEDFLIIRRGIFDLREQALLDKWLQAAVVWEENLPPQVLVDNKTAVQAISDTALQSVYTYQWEGKSRLRIVKVANKHNARPGDVVEFTLRFDNVGDQTIGNVTIVDSLSRRLEYVEGSQQCSLQSNFITEPNEGESLTLRWEVLEPLKVGDGGTIRFQCIVR